MKNRTAFSAVAEYYSVILLSVAAALVRLWCVRYSDLPSGDEINTYINNAQKFAHDFSLPSLENFPLTAIVYGIIIKAIDFFTVTLSGVIAHSIIAILAGFICTFFLYIGVKKVAGKKTGFVVAAGVAFFPGSLSVFRADISLYYILMPMLSLSFILLVKNPCWLRAIWTGIIGALFYFSRSDGLFIFFISIFLFNIYYKSIFKMSAVSVLAFIFTITLFLGFEYYKKGKIGNGARGRAISAFYQAEGLHDKKGGSWQDYTARGVARFGSAEKYNRSIFLLIIKNPDAVYDRINNNIKIVNSYVVNIHMPIWVVYFLFLCAFFGRYRQIVILFATPCIATSCIYLLFYYQISYFTILSYGLTIGLTCGLLALSEIAVRAFQVSGWKNKIYTAEYIYLAIIFGYMIYVNIDSHPNRATTKQRYWDALVFVKEKCHDVSSNCFFAPPYRGSRAIPIFMNIPGAAIEYGNLSKLPWKEQRQRLKEKNIKYLICGQEDQSLWLSPEQGEHVLYLNLLKDVKVVTLN